jgi:N-acetyl-gamma-glutamyl-phosphate reductase
MAFREMEKGQGEAIAAAEYVADPGCYATGAIALLRRVVGRSPHPSGFPHHHQARSTAIPAAASR